MPLDGAARFLLRNVHVGRQPAVVGDDQAVGLLVDVRADDVGVGPLQNAHDDPFGALRAGALLDAHEHLVAVHGTAHVVGVHVDVRLARLVGNDEGETLGVGLEPPAHQVHPLRHAVAVGAGAHHFPLVFEAV